MDPKLRREEFPQLSGNVIYLDHAGATLFSKSQIESFTADVTSNLYGNPHTGSQTGQLTSDTIDQVRTRLLKHFNTTIDTHSVIFTSGCTAALKLLAETFPWSPADRSRRDSSIQRNGESPSKRAASVFCYLQDNHTSVVGMREVASSQGARTRIISPADVGSACAQTENSSLLSSEPTDDNSSASHLFVFPSQSNFSGYKYPLQWIEKCKHGCLDQVVGCHGSWFIALDAASLVSTSELDLSVHDADFVSVSFYKMFGFPTGLGALIAKKEALVHLRKTYFGGGAVAAYSATQQFHAPRKLLHEWFEDGTLPFLDIIALRHGFDALDSLAGGIQNVTEHTFELARHTYQTLRSMRHSNGRPLLRCYSETDYSDCERQGPVISFNLLRPNGEYVGYAEFQKLASLYQIELRTGCFCNVGACQYYLGLSDEDIKGNFDAGHVCGDDIDMINGMPTGAVRISFGYMSLRSDADAFLDFVRDTFVDYKLRVAGETKVCENRISPRESADCVHNGVAHPVLSQICLYPVKSCSALKVNQWEIGPQGLMYDRLWMIVNEAGVFLSQKRLPKMCMIQPSIDLDKRLLTLGAQGMDPISLPLDADPAESVLEMKSVCADRCQTFDCGDLAADWFTKVLGQRCRLHKQNAKYARRRRTERCDVSGLSKLSLANVDQYLLIMEASSTAFMESLAGHSLGALMDRFRANFVVSGALEPFEEDRWQKIRIGGNVFEVTELCMRCRMISIDQMTAGETKETFRELTSRRGRKASFGILLRRVEEECSGDNTIFTGMTVDVLE